MNMRHWLTGSLILLMIALPRPALALTCSADIRDLSFGTVDVLTGDNPLATSSAQVSVTCQRDLLELGAMNTITACVYIGNGSGGTSGGLRQLGSGANSLRYQLYADAARSVPWGSDTEFASPGPRRFLLSLPLLTLSDSVSTTLYGSVSGGQATAAVGSYTSSFSGASTQVRYAVGNRSCESLSATAVRAPFAVDAVVAPNCSISADTLDFGTVTALDRAVDGVGRISSTCTRGAAYQISLDNGRYASGNQRQMASGNSRANYELYRDAARSQRWGQRASGEAVAGTGTGLAVLTSIYGRVPVQSGMTVGSYADTVIAIISF